MLVSFSEDIYYVQENADVLAIDVELSHRTVAASRVQFQIIGLSANENEDYLLVEEWMAFLPGETRKTLNVSIVDDLQGEPAETFVISFSDTRNASVGAIPSTKIVIQDDDNDLPNTWMPLNTPNLSLEISDPIVSKPSLLGYSVSMAGDVDGDSHPDMLIGAYENSRWLGWAGIAYLVYGKDVLESQNNSIDLGATSIGLYGPRKAAWVGHSVSIGGDIDGDGLSDFAVGARFDTLTSTRKIGIAYVLFSTALPNNPGMYPIDEYASVLLTRTVKNSNVGFEVLVGGDIDGDHIADLIIHADIDPVKHTGGVYIVPGSLLREYEGQTIDLDKTRGITRVFSSLSYVDAGRTITLMNDYDGDTLPELVLGSANGASYYAPDQEISVAPNLWILPSRMLASEKEEINLDDDEAVLRLYLDNSVTNHVAVGSAGDIDQDGLGDVIMGITPIGSLSDLPGSAALILGSTLIKLQGDHDLLNVADVLIISEEQGYYENGDFFGWSVSEATGDIDRDGIPDLLIGARGSSLNSIQSGAIYVIPGKLVQQILGSDNQTLYVHREPEVMIVVGDQSYLLLGSKRRISNASDINGDGYADILVGAPGVRANGDHQGSAFIIWGEALTRLWAQLSSSNN